MWWIVAEKRYLRKRYGRYVWILLQRQHEKGRGNGDKKKRFQREDVGGRIDGADDY